jgi:FO synthase
VAELDDAVLDGCGPRALHRAEEGRTLTRDEATALLTCRDEDLERLLTIAGRVRDAAPWYAEGRGAGHPMAAAG